MRRLLLKPAALAYLAILALFTGQTVVAAPPASDGPSSVCTSIPATTGNVLDAGVATAEDVKAFQQSVNLLRTELNTLCRQDKAASKRFRNQAKSVVFEMSAGATEPTAYLKDSRLVIEFYGGDFDAGAFRQLVKKVLKGQKIPLND